MDILKKFNMLNCKAAVTPINTNENLFQNDGIEKVDETNYRKLVKILIYLTPLVQILHSLWELFLVLCSLL